MRCLLAIAHYAPAATPEALATLPRCVVGWRALASWGVQDFGGPCQATQALDLDIVVVDDGRHSVAEYVGGMAERVSVDGDPLRLPLACRALLDARRADYDLLAYSEHDNWPVTGTFFTQVAESAHAHPDQVLIPHRFERIDVPPYKVYIDGNNGWGAYGAMWCVTAAQWGRWRQQPHFVEYTDVFAGPLESGCAWSLLRTFVCTKPADPRALESEHAGERYARRAIGRGIVWTS